MAIRRLLIYLIFLINFEYVFANSKINIVNNTLSINNKSILTLDEQQNIRIAQLDAYILVLVFPKINTYKNTIVYREDLEDFFLLNISLYDKIYFFNQLLIFRENSKTGKWIILNLLTKKESVVKKWIDDIYIVNNDLCLLIDDEYESILDGVKYSKNLSNTKLVELKVTAPY